MVSFCIYSLSNDHTRLSKPLGHVFGISLARLPFSAKQCKKLVGQLASYSDKPLLQTQTVANILLQIGTSTS